MSTRYNLRRRKTENSSANSGKGKIGPKSLAPEISYVENLPLEILKKIFSYLPVLDKIRCEGVCKLWAEILRSFWQGLNEIDFDLGKFIKVINSSGNKKVASKIQVDLRNKLTWSDFCYNSIRYKLTSSNLKKLRLDNISCDSSVISVINDNFPNMEVLIFNSVKFCNNIGHNDFLLQKLLTMKNLKELVMKDCDMRQFTIPKSSAKNLKSNLTHLKLAKFYIGVKEVSEKFFIPMCQLVGSTLENICFKPMWFNESTISKGLKYLTNLRHLNLGYSLGMMPRFSIPSLNMDHVALISVARFCHSLETLNLKRNHCVTSIGITTILRSSCCRETLRLLNIEKCELVNDEIRKALENRSADAPMLKIFASGSGISTAFANSSDDRSNWRVVIDQKSEIIHFYGEETDRMFILGSPASSNDDDDDGDGEDGDDESSDVNAELVD